MKNRKYKIEDDHRKVYEQLLEHAIHLIQDHEPELVAGSLMAIAQRLYRTHLDDEDYRQIMDVIKDAPVEPYGVKKVRLH